MSDLDIQTNRLQPSHLRGVAAEEGAGGCADMSWVIRRGIQLRALGSVWHKKKMEAEFNSAGYVFNYLGKRAVLELEWSYWRSHPQHSQAACAPPGFPNWMSLPECPLPRKSPTYPSLRQSGC